MLSTIKKQILMIGEKPMQTLSDRKSTTQTHLQNIPQLFIKLGKSIILERPIFLRLKSFVISTLISALNYSPKKN